MTIAKPFDKILTRESIESNNTILPGDEFHVCYADPTESKNPIGYVNCGEDYEYFLQIVDWLNDTKLSALIWIEDSSIIKGRNQLLPETLGTNLCFSYEGFYAEKDFVQKLSEMKKTVDNFLNPAMVWMLEKLTKEKNLLIFMDSAGKFTRFGYYSWYNDSEIMFCIYGKASKNQNNWFSKSGAAAPGLVDADLYEGYCG